MILSAFPMALGSLRWAIMKLPLSQIGVSSGKWKEGPMLIVLIVRSAHPQWPTTLLVVWLATCQFLFLSFHIFNWQIMTLRLWVAKWWINTCILHKIIVMLIITSITHLSLPNSFSQTGKISFNDLLPTVATGYNFLSFAQGGHSFWSFTHVLHALLASKK